MNARYENRHRNSQSDLPINGEKLYARRIKIGLTQQELADLAEISPGFVSKVEREESGVSNEVLERRADALITHEHLLCY